VARVAEVSRSKAEENGNRTAESTFVLEIVVSVLAASLLGSTCNKQSK
jgi:hypothetical protein